MDRAALRLANLLVGNAAGEAALEVTLLGPVLELLGDVLLSVTGADLSVSLDDSPLPLDRAVHAHAGARLAFGRPVAGCRAYVAFAGGIAVQPVLGSLATYVRAGLGGLAGRALAAGDLLPLGEPGEWSQRLGATIPPGRTAPWGPAPQPPARLGEDTEVRALRGAHFDALTHASRKALLALQDSPPTEQPEWFVVTGESDRMGYRLDGPALELEHPLELVSEPVAFGTVQLPPGGKPIVLMADRQTTGGYPRVLEVASADLSLLAQASPGTRVRFREVSLDEAQRLYLAREHRRSRLALAISLHLP
jgi:antagonist of KipI